MRVQDLCDELDSLVTVGSVELRPGTESGAAELVDVVHDSRAATTGTVFCAVPGLTVDGHRFGDEAVANGASALVVERWLNVDRPQIRVDDVRSVMPFVAALVHGWPSRSLAVFGITGTNGKTTTTQLFASILAAAGSRCTIVGTLGGIHTTPESTDLQRRLRTDADDGVEVVALEVSSHALDQHRVDATDFAVAAFSNLTPDHLDYHGDMERYFEAKSRLFDGRAAVELINTDDEWGERLVAERAQAHGLSLAQIAITSERLNGTDFVWRGLPTHVPIPGRMNVSNALMAAEAARSLGVDDASIVDGLANAKAVPGRMERVPGAKDMPTVIVDYSHTPDSIERALDTLRSVDPAASITIVFGCGGDRDKAKRPLMGRAAEQGADRVYVTSDNPRSEDPVAIINQAVAGMANPQLAIVDPDRRAAIGHAIRTTGPNGVVLIAGKGHEKTQTIGTDRLPFDDVLVAASFLGEVNT